MGVGCQRVKWEGVHVMATMGEVGPSIWTSVLVSVVVREEQGFCVAVHRWVWVEVGVLEHEGKEDLVRAGME